MVESRFALAAVIFLVLVLFGCSRSGVTPNGNTAPGNAVATSSTKFVKASATEAQLSPDGSGEATVRVAVQNGYHINANPPTFSYLKATELTVKNADPVQVSFITYPNAVTKKFSFAEQPLAVYEGEVVVRLTLKAAKGAAKQTYSLPAKFNVQACDDQVCYAPGSIDLTVPVTVK